MDIELQTFTWRGATRFRCPDCDWDGPTQHSVVKHWLESHKPKEAAVGPTLFDADDKPIDRSILARGLARRPNVIEVITEEKAMDIELQTFTWRGATRFRCPDCDWDGPTQHSVVKHWLESHKPKEAAVGPTLFDADDKPIDRSIYAPGFELPNFLASDSRGEGSDEELSGIGNWDDSGDGE